MIKLKFVNNCILVYDINDWLALRKDHRIMGHIIGCTNFIPSLPLKLLPEEAILLLDKNLASIFKNDENVSATRSDLSDFEDILLVAQQHEYKEVRKIQLLSLIDKIIEKRRKLGDERSEEDIFNDELNKSSVVSKENMLWPILLQDSNHTCVSVPKHQILPLTDIIRKSVYRDLWEKGYYITSGEKFGGDFLIYLGDPIVHHAVFIVKCIDSEKTFTPTELIAFGRLGVSVKKKAVLASLRNGIVQYLTIDWIDA